MKYMKLGSKPDIFRAEGNIRTVATELDSDVILQVEDIMFHLHKFPLLSKCARLQRLMAEAHDDGIVKLKDIPGGAQAFELCAKFCYGITVTLNAHNVISVRCAADYLGMTEDVDRGNLIFKIEVFLSSSIFKSWKDSIIALKTTKALLPWSQDLKMVSRCIDAIASKTSVDPSKVEWSFTFTRSKRANEIRACGSSNSPPWNGTHSNRHTLVVPKDWWVEDISELEIDLYWRVMVAIKSKGRMSHRLIGEALRVYAYRWLPGISKDQNLLGSSHAPQHHMQTADKHKLILETIVSLLPSEKGSCSCSFLLRLLKAATILCVENSTKMELARRIGLQLEEASLNDLLIPSLSYTNDALYDVDLVQQILDYFMMQDGSPAPGSPVRDPYEKRRSRSADQLEFMENQGSASHSAKLQVAKIIDGYLTEVARDPNLPLSKFIALAESIPEYSRPVHDGLYRAIDVYLKEHPTLSKSERKRICRLMDCKKLSMDACMHAAQNERLPLRVVVQVLFFEQVRTAMTGGLILNELPSNIKALLPQTESSDEHQEENNVQGTFAQDWESVHNEFNALKGDLAEMKRKIDEAEREKGRNHSQQQETASLKLSKTRNLLSSSKRILNRLLSVRQSSSGSKDSDMSKSSGSSVSSVPIKVVDDNSVVRRRRSHSIS